MTTENYIYVTDFGEVKLVGAIKYMDTCHPRWREYIASKRFWSKKAKYARKVWHDIETTASTLSTIRWVEGCDEVIIL